MTDVILSLGTNMGDRASYIRRMEQELEPWLFPPRQKSRLMETEPIGVDEAQQWYYNRLIRGACQIGVRELLAECLAIEQRLGRTRPSRYAPRTADIDILFFGELQVHEDDLTIPHPGIFERRFCCIGLGEIAGDWIYPGSTRLIASMATRHESKLSMQGVTIMEPEPGDLKA